MSILLYYYSFMTSIIIGIHGQIEDNSIIGFTSTLKGSLGSNLDPSCFSKTDLCPCNLTFRTIDGTCNNPINPEWGQANAVHIRNVNSFYDDGISTIRTSFTDGSTLPNVREVSVAVLGQVPDKDTKEISVMTMIWGQFIDHDVTKTPITTKDDGDGLDCCGDDKNKAACSRIDTANDTFFSGFGVNCFGFSRSQTIDLNEPWEQINQLTSYIDGSMIYGSSDERLLMVRKFEKGRMKANMPTKVTGMKKIILPIQKGDSCTSLPVNSKDECVVAGDDRFAEQIGITILHMIFLREHNKIADKLSTLNPKWGDERIFQETRKIIIAMLQQITYQEYLPLILGYDVMKRNGLSLVENKGHFSGYRSNINPTTRNEFVAAAFRFGHSQIPGLYHCLDSKFQPVKSIPPIPLRKIFLSNFFFHNPPQSLVPANNTENLGDCFLRGLITKPAKEIDITLSDEVRLHLFQSSQDMFGIDLASLNILRGRDHGLPPYVKMREFCQLSIPRTFDDLIGIIKNETIEPLRKLYKSVEDLDFFPLGLAEIPTKGSLLGPTFTCVIWRQFKALRVGDSFWYENITPKRIFTLEQLLEIRKITLAKILCSNLDDMPEIQLNPLLMTHPIWNPLVSCSIMPYIEFTSWKE